MRTKNITSNHEVDYSNNANVNEAGSLASKANLVKEFNERNNK